MPWQALPARDYLARMFTSDAERFRTRQAIADLRHVATSADATCLLRMAEGASRRSDHVARSLRWYAAGTAPATALRGDREAFVAVLMASALPEDDPPAFLTATAILLLERLESPFQAETFFWSWRRLAPHWRRAEPATRAALMCGFREAARLGRVALDGGPDASDCLTAHRSAVIAALETVANPLTDTLLTAIGEEIDAAPAGRLWAASHEGLATLPDPVRAAALTGARYLYERPASLSLPDDAGVPTIPPAR